MNENGEEKKHKGQTEGKIEFLNSTVKAASVFLQETLYIYHI